MKSKFFLTLTLATGLCLSAFTQNNEIVIKTGEAKDTISRYIYGHFAEHLGRCIYDGIWVGEDSPIPNTRGIRNDVIEALKEIEVPVLRWPGGCFADLYHWKDGIGPKEDRPPLVNKFWGNVVEDNSFGTHEFMDLCELIGADPYVSVNVGSGTVEEAHEWVEYITSDGNGPMANLRRQNGREEPWKVKFWCIGNENWGCGGNMTADYYSSLFKRYSTYCWGEYKVASGGLNDDFNWTETLMKNTKDYQHLIQGYSYHHYTVCNNWQTKGSAIDFDKTEWFQTISKNMEMGENLKQHIAIMDKYDPNVKIGFVADEWGNWHDPEPGTNRAFLFQQNTMRDAITASIYLNIFNTNCHRVKMANIAQTVNVLQAMVLTRGEKMVKTPTFYVFKMYKVHRDALMLPLEISCDDYTVNDQSVQVLSASASKDDSGNINLTVSNVHPDNALAAVISVDKGGKFKVVNAKIITSENINDYNDFDKEEKINIKDFKGYKVKGDKIEADLPSKSVVLLTLSDN